MAETQAMSSSDLDSQRVERVRKQVDELLVQCNRLFDDVEKRESDTEWRERLQELRGVGGNQETKTESKQYWESMSTMESERESIWHKDELNDADDRLAKTRDDIGRFAKTALALFQRAAQACPGTKPLGDSVRKAKKKLTPLNRENTESIKNFLSEVTRNAASLREKLKILVPDRQELKIPVSDREQPERGEDADGEGRARRGPQADADHHRLVADVVSKFEQDQQQANPDWRERNWRLKPHLKHLDALCRRLDEARAGVPAPWEKKDQEDWKTAAKQEPGNVIKSLKGSLKWAKDHSC